MENKKYITAFDLCGFFDGHQFRLKGGGRVIWEDIVYRDSCDKCNVSRIVEDGGKSWFMGLRVKNQYIDPDTLIEIIEK